MVNEDKIIVTMTSYRNRINSIYDVVSSVLNNTIIPDNIICNLSSDEFPEMEKELPEKLVKLQDNGIFEIHWVKENVRQFKKLIPTLERFPNDIVISIDDDNIYNKNFVKTLYDEYLKHERQCPITTGSYIWENNVYSHNGGGTLVTANMFGEYLSDLYYNFAFKHIVENNIKVFDDPLYTYAMLLSGKRYKYVKIDNKSIFNSDTITHAGNTIYRKSIFHWHDMIKAYIKEKYNKTYDDLFSAPINVNFTTWKKREKAVPIMLETIKKQTLKPNRVIVFLSETEYEHVVPNVIQKMYNEGYITDIEWVEGNIYSHKRWEAIKKYNDCYNVFVDDDVLYTSTHVQDLYNKAIKNQGCEIVWTTQVEEIVGTKRTHPMERISDKSKKFQTLSGLSCFPPYTYPLEAFKHAEERDKWCTKCDDSWNRAWMIKNDIDVVRVNNRHMVGFRCVPDTSEEGIWAENKTIVNGIETMMKNFSNALVCANSVDKAKTIWPKFDVHRCCSPELLNKDLCNEKIIVTLTTWRKRVGNIPVVLDTIIKQTKMPDKIVLNLSSAEFENKEADFSEKILEYLKLHSDIIEVNWVDGVNTKQWKKILPTLKLYPHDCIICIDDDFLYPCDMIETLWRAHLRYPKNPISGNSVKYQGVQCQCGCASLLKLDYLKDVFDYATPEVQKLHSSDIFFTYVAAKGGTPYVYCGKSYFTNMKRFNEVKPLHNEASARNALTNMWNYLVNAFGNISSEKKNSSTSANRAMLLNTPQTSASSYISKKAVQVCNKRQIKTKTQTVVPYSTGELKQTKPNTSKPVKVNINRATKPVISIKKEPNTSKPVKVNINRATKPVINIKREPTLIKQGTRILRYTPNTDIREQKLEVHSRTQIKKVRIRKNNFSNGFFR